MGSLGDALNENMATPCSSAMWRSGIRFFRSVRILTVHQNGSPLLASQLPVRSIHLQPVSCNLRPCHGSAVIFQRYGYCTGQKKPETSQQPVETLGRDLEESGDPEESFEEHELTIYRGILATQIKMVKSFSLMTSLIGLSCQPLLFMKLSETSGSSFVMLAGAGAFFSMFTFATPLLIHWVSKKYATEMLYNKIENTYTAITYSFLLRKKQITFTVDEVKTFQGMFTTFKVKGNHFFVDQASFYFPHHYGKIMGYDKPVDLRWKDGHTDSHAEVLEEQRRKMS